MLPVWWMRQERKLFRKQWEMGYKQFSCVASGTGSNAPRLVPAGVRERPGTAGAMSPSRRSRSNGQESKNCGKSRRITGNPGVQHPRKGKEKSLKDWALRDFMHLSDTIDAVLRAEASRRVCGVQVFLPKAKTLAQGGFTPPEHFNHPRGGGGQRPPEPKQKDTPKRVLLFGGDYWTRTSGLMRVKHAL